MSGLVALHELHRTVNAPLTRKAAKWIGLRLILAAVVGALSYSVLHALSGRDWVTTPVGWIAAGAAAPYVFRLQLNELVPGRPRKASPGAIYDRFRKTIDYQIDTICSSEISDRIRSNLGNAPVSEWASNARDFIRVKSMLSEDEKGNALQQIEDAEKLDDENEGKKLVAFQLLELGAWLHVKKLLKR